MMKLASLWSLMTLNSSFRTNKISNLDKIGSDNSTFSLKLSLSSYVPFTGFAAAITEQRALREATIPAFDIEMLYCSMASWIEVQSASFILSNSSIRQIPVSANTKAPPSKHPSWVTGSFLTAAVRPTADAPLPVV